MATPGVRAQDADLAHAKQLYEANCSLCHGTLSPRHASQFPLRHRLVAGSNVVPWNASMTHTRLDSSHRLSPRVAVAPPYGPPLRGVFGRPAGSLTTFSYSKAFKRMLHGVVWDRKTLDVWLTDSQAWVPGSLMFYQQPNADIRRQIIDYLEAAR